MTRQETQAAIDALYTAGWLVDVYGDDVLLHWVGPGEEPPPPPELQQWISANKVHLLYCAYRRAAQDNYDRYFAEAQKRHAAEREVERLSKELAALRRAGSGLERLASHNRTVH